MCGISAFTIQFYNFDEKQKNKHDIFMYNRVQESFSEYSFLMAPAQKLVDFEMQFLFHCSQFDISKSHFFFFD